MNSNPSLQPTELQPFCDNCNDDDDDVMFYIPFNII